MDQALIARLMESFRIMGLGMLGIFVVIVIFYITILALNKLLPPDKEE